MYDGRWDRKIGSDGGREITWTGKCGMIAACTGVIDKAHAVVAAMGTRWVFVRLEKASPSHLAKSALSQVGREKQMRDELASAVRDLLSDLPGQPHRLEPVEDGLVALACLVSQARSATMRDARGEIDLVLDPEAPTRLIKRLGQLWRACGLLGLDYRKSWEVVTRAGFDSIPMLRGSVIRCLAKAGRTDTSTVSDPVDAPPGAFAEPWKTSPRTRS